MKGLVAALAWALAAPAVAQGTSGDGAAPPSAPPTEVAPADAPPPPPSIEIPGVDVPAAPPVQAPAPAVKEVPPPEPAGPTFVPTAPIQVAPQIRRGSGYFGLGVGIGTANFARKSFLGSGAALFSLRAGKIFHDQLLVGPEVVFTGQYDEWAENTMVGAGLSSVMMQVMAFPVIDRPFNVAVGAGWGSGLQVSRLNKANDGVPVVADGNDGVSWMTALGWDFFAGRGWNLGVQARYDGVYFVSNETNTRALALQFWMNSY